jgi:hypothetical protein
MAPIHRTDVDESRFEQDEWRNYELWEKLAHRERKKKKLWIFATGAVFLLLSSVPVVMERMPKWQSLAASRRLAVLLNSVKREAALEHAPYRLRFVNAGVDLAYVIERVESCPPPPGSEGVIIHTGEIARVRGVLALIAPEEGPHFGLDGLLQEFCYDSIEGTARMLDEKPLGGFAIAPVNDLANGSLDRASIVLIDGKEGELSFQ